MATPLGHSLVAGIFYLLRDDPRDKVVPCLLFFLLFANAPDLDFLPGLLLGEISRFHHGISHSLGFGILFTGIVCGVMVSLRWLPKDRAFYWFVMGYFLYLSHLLVDSLTLDNGYPYGMPIFWPFSDAYFNVPFYFFPNVLHGPGAISWHNLTVAFRETWVFGPAILFLLYARRKGIISDLKQRLLALSIILGILLGTYLKKNPFYS